MTMVYCGKPSKGCGNCRAKRTKCDLARPGCGQCRRAARICLGYRDEEDLKFRDQSRTVAARVNASREAQTLQKSGTVSGSACDLTESVCSSSELMVLPMASSNVQMASLVDVRLDMSPEDQAAGYFFTNYVIGADEFRNGYNGYLPRIYATLSPNSAVLKMITALGMAGIANARGAPEAQAVATYQYASALRSVNYALQDTSQAMADETLITILLLSLYETNTGALPQSLQSWIKHINGAMTLLRLRGQDQLQHTVGLHLFHQFRSQILIGCLHRRVAIPDIFSTWSVNARRHEDPEVEYSVEEQLYQLCAKLCNFRAKNLPTSTERTRLLTVLDGAMALDREMGEWLLRFQLSHGFSICPIGETSTDVFSDHYHIYQDLFSALLWNHYRSCRLLLNETIVTQIAGIYYFNHGGAVPELDTSSAKDIALPPDFPFTNHFYNAHALLTSLCHDICASIPYFFGYHLHGSYWDKVQPPPAAAKGNMLLWSLFMVAQLKAASPMIRLWALGRLRKIDEVMGVRQAGMIASYLERDERFTILRDM